MAERPPAPSMTGIFQEPQYRPQSERHAASPPAKGAKPTKVTRKRGTTKGDPLARLRQQRRALLARVATKQRQGDRAGAAALAARAAQLERQILKLSPPKPAKNTERGKPLRIESLVYRGVTSPRRVRFWTGRRS